MFVRGKLKLNKTECTRSCRATFGLFTIRLWRQYLKQRGWYFHIMENRDFGCTPHYAQPPRRCNLHRLWQISRYYGRYSILQSRGPLGPDFWPSEKNTLYNKTVRVSGSVRIFNLFIKLGKNRNQIELKFQLNMACSANFGLYQEASLRK